MPREPQKPLKISAGARAAAAGDSIKPYFYPVRKPDLYPGVLPPNVKPGKSAIAMDDAAYNYSQQFYGGQCGFSGFPGYPYLAMLATRPEYRAFAEAISTEITREWIVLNSSETAGDETREKITELTEEIKKIGLQLVIKKAATHDAYFGRGQIFLDVDGQDKDDPLVLSPKTVKKGASIRLANVEPMWTTPVAYNALDPTAPDFYKPTRWFMMGQPVHATRLLTIVTREVPDMLKPAFNFSGMSISQLSEPYVDNWIQTRKSVGDLLLNFSTTALKTAMEEILNGGAGEDLFKRAELFTLGRTNRGLMLLDKDKEDLVQINTPLSGLAELQSQAEEHMGLPSRMPMVVLTGISPTGLNASSEGEIRVWYDWIAASQEFGYRSPIETVVKLLQLSMYGKIDPEIIVSFQPLFQMTPKELAEIRLNNSTAAGNYIDHSVIDPGEERERLARDPESGYQGLELNKEPEILPDATEDEGDEA